MAVADCVNADMLWQAYPLRSGLHNSPDLTGADWLVHLGHEDRRVWIGGGVPRKVSPCLSLDHDGPGLATLTEHGDLPGAATVSDVPTAQPAKLGPAYAGGVQKPEDRAIPLVGLGLYHPQHIGL